MISVATPTRFVYFLTAPGLTYHLLQWKWSDTSIIFAYKYNLKASVLIWKRNCLYHFNHDLKKMDTFWKLTFLSIFSSNICHIIKFIWDNPLLQIGHKDIQYIHTSYKFHSDIFNHDEIMATCILIFSQIGILPKWCHPQFCCLITSYPFLWG